MVAPAAELASGSGRTGRVLQRLPYYWAVLAVLVGLGIGVLHPGQKVLTFAALESTLLDLRHRIRGIELPTAPIAIVAIDDKTLSELDRFPLPRKFIAEALEKTLAADASVIAVDLLLLEAEAPSNGITLSPGDSSLFSILDDTDKVVLAATGTSRGGLSEEIASGEALAGEVAELAPALLKNAIPVEQRGEPASRPHNFDHVSAPIDAFANVAGIAHVNLPLGSGRSFQKVPLAIGIGDGQYLPAISLEVARRHEKLARGDVRVVLGEGVSYGSKWWPTEADGSIALSFYGPRGTIPTYPLIDIIQGRKDPKLLSGKIVFIGYTAFAIGDLFASPFSDDMPGVEAHATATANLLGDSYLRRDNVAFALDLIACAVFGVLAFFAANFVSLPISAGATAIVWALAAALVQTAFARQNLWMDAVSVLATLTVIGLLTFAARIVLQRRLAGQLQKQRDNLAAYQSPLIADWLASEERPSFNERLQEAAILFVDVIGFTRRSKALGPVQTAAFLSELHRLFERAALDNGGFIEQFAGDGAMMIFGLPTPRPGDAAAALACAKDMLNEAEAWSDKLLAQGQDPVRLRIGLHAGPVMAARLGGERHHHVTVTGDTVNVASRFMEIVRQQNATVVASQTFVDRVAEYGRGELLSGYRRLPAQVLRGRPTPIDVLIWP